MLEWGHTWRDTSDGYIYGKQQILTGAVVGTKNPDIRQTAEWEQYEAWKNMIRENLTRGDNATPPVQWQFEHWDDGWRIATK
jgi:hypothetical protein